MPRRLLPRPPRRRPFARAKRLGRRGGLLLLLAVLWAGAAAQVAAAHAPYDAAVAVLHERIPTANAGLKMEIRTGGGSLVWATGASGTPVSQRKFMEEGSSPYFLDANLALGTELHFVIKNTNAGAINAVAHATFGFGGELAP